MKPHEPHEAAVRRAKKLRQEYLARNYFSRDPDDGLLALRPVKPAGHGPLQKLTAQEKSRQTRLHIMKEKRERERIKREIENHRRKGQVRLAACGWLPSGARTKGSSTHKLPMCVLVSVLLRPRACGRNSEKGGLERGERRRTKENEMGHTTRTKVSHATRANWPLFRTQPKSICRERARARERERERERERQKVQ